MNRGFCGPIGTFWASVNVVVNGDLRVSTFWLRILFLRDAEAWVSPGHQARSVKHFSLHANWDNTLAASTQHVLVAAVGFRVHMHFVGRVRLQHDFSHAQRSRCYKTQDQPSGAKWSKMRGELRRAGEIEPTPRIGVWGHAFSDMEMAYDLLRWCDLRLRSRLAIAVQMRRGRQLKELGEWGKAALERLTSAHARLLHEWECVKHVHHELRAFWWSHCRCCRGAKWSRCEASCWS